MHAEPEADVHSVSASGGCAPASAIIMMRKPDRERYQKGPGINGQYL